MADTVEVDLRDDGTIVFPFDEPVTLSNPKLGAFRKLRERQQDIWDRAVKLAETDESVDEDGEILGWMHEVFDMLGDKPLPADDDLPAWITSAHLVIAMLGHWRRVPLPSGVL